jgi:hypothetical protein
MYKGYCLNSRARGKGRIKRQSRIKWQGRHDSRGKAKAWRHIGSEVLICRTEHLYVRLDGKEYSKIFPKPIDKLRNFL